MKNETVLGDIIKYDVADFINIKIIAVVINTHERLCCCNQLMDK